MSSFPDYSLEWIMTELHRTNRFISLLIAQSALYILITPARHHPSATGDHGASPTCFCFPYILGCSVFHREMSFCMPPLPTLHFTEWAVWQEVMDLGWSTSLVHKGFLSAQLSWFLSKIHFICTNLWTPRISFWTAAFKEHTDCFHSTGWLKAVIGWLLFELSWFS